MTRKSYKPFDPSQDPDDSKAKNKAFLGLVEAIRTGVEPLSGDFIRPDEARKMSRNLAKQINRDRTN